MSWFNKSRVKDPDLNKVQANAAKSINSLCKQVNGISTQLGFNTLTRLTTYTALPQDAILADTSAGAFTVTLPTAVGNLNKQIVLKKVSSDGNSVTASAGGTETIDGQSTKIINGQWDAMKIISDGSNWYIF